MDSGRRHEFKSGFAARFYVYATYDKFTIEELDKRDEIVLNKTSNFVKI